MSGFAITLIALFLVAIVIVIISVVAYNKHLDKVAKGEERDAHSSVPEPRATADAVYKTVLIAIVSISMITVSGLAGRLNSLNNTLNGLRSDQRAVSYDLLDLKEEVKKNASVIQNVEWNMGNPDLSTLMADIDYTVVLKRYSDDTKVMLDLNGTEIQMEKTGSGRYRASFKAGLFDDYKDATIDVTENGVTTKENTDFPEYLFWSLLPMPSVQCTFSANNSGGKLRYSGTYTITPGNLDDVEKVLVTYMTSGKDLKTLDVTKETLNMQSVTLEKGLAVEKDLTFRIEITTKTGFKIVEYAVMIYDASTDLDKEDSTAVYDKDGKLLWKEDIAKQY